MVIKNKNKNLMVVHWVVHVSQRLSNTIILKSIINYSYGDILKTYLLLNMHIFREKDTFV